MDCETKPPASADGHSMCSSGELRSISIICGTRPEIIKLAPVYHLLRNSNWGEVRWIHTGQHDAMAQEMLRCFGISPDVQLTRDGGSLEEFSVSCRRQLDAVLDAGDTRMCMVQGDTESAFLGALSAFYHRIPIAHVEAGLRTYNLGRPFPEEGLRQMITRLAALNFAPTARASSALHDEGVPPERVRLTGNTVVDAQLWVCEKYGIRRGADCRGRHILVTIHRREHWGAEMQAMFAAVAEIAREHPSTPILFPVHLNPAVRIPAEATLAGIPNVRLTAPMNYVAMQRALAESLLVLTDSGGLQEEAPTYGVPVLVLRQETERPEGLLAGCARLVGPQREHIVAETRRLLRDESALGRMQRCANPYGDGQASGRIVSAINDYLSLRQAS